MDPYKAEASGMPFKEFRTLQDLANDNGYVDPYQAEDRGVDYQNWSRWQREHGY